MPAGFGQSSYWPRSDRGSSCESDCSSIPHSGIKTESFSSETHGHEEAEWLSHSISSVGTFVNILNLVSSLRLRLECDSFQVKWEYSGGNYYDGQKRSGSSTEILDRDIVSHGSLQSSKLRHIYARVDSGMKVYLKDAQVISLRHCKQWKPSIQKTTSDIRTCRFRYTWSTLERRSGYFFACSNTAGT